MAASSSSSVIARRRRNADDQLVVQKIPKLTDGSDASRRRSLVLHGGTKTSLVNVLSQLQESGMLPSNDSGRALRKIVAASSTEHARTMTPYGRVVQETDLHVPSLNKWGYCHPLAYLHHLSTLSDDLGNALEECIHPNEPAHIVLYVDEVCPGNPFRPERSRTIQCIYWFMSDWPEWLLCRSAVWPVFGVLRSTFLEFYPGGISAFWAKIIRLMFLAEHSFERGVIIVRDEAPPLLLRGTYSGTIADEKALKEINGYKGASGTKFCMDCGNVIKSTAELPAGLVGTNASSLADVERNSNDDIWGMCDELAALAAMPRSKAELERKEQLYGVKFIDGGLLYDIPLRQVHRPIDHYLRDWMHTIVSGGVGNTQTAMILHKLASLNIKATVVGDFSQECILPKKYGKVSSSWLHPTRLKDDTLSSFASVMLSVVPIVAMFLVDCVQGQPGAETIEDHIACYLLLTNILGLLCMGAESAMPHVELLATRIVQHHELYASLYDGIDGAFKPKFHHMLHLPEVFARLGRVVSCFTAERKHRASKRAALYVFRHLEQTVMADLINAQCQQMTEGHNLFRKSFLAHPRVMTLLGDELHRSTQAVLICGYLFAGDVVYIEGGTLARIVAFWKKPTSSTIVAHCTEMTMTVGHRRYIDSSTPLFVTTETIVDACIYRPLGMGVLRVWLPFAARFR